jgi:arabinofuranan 3-O-arabinosyltransferase
VVVDGLSFPTSVRGTIGDILAGRRLALRPCAGPVDLPAGRHSVSVGATEEFRPATLSLVPATWRRTPQATVRAVTAQTWDLTHRTVLVGAGAASLLVLNENFNPGWVARLGTEPLRSVRVDGWVQAYLVPAGAGGRVELTFAPDRPYRASLLLLPLAFALLVAGSTLPGRGTPSPVPELRSRRVIWFASLVAVVLLGGWWGLAAFVAAGLAFAGWTRLYGGHRAPYPLLVAVPVLVAGTLVVLWPWGGGDEPALLGLGAQVSCLLTLSMLGWVVSGPYRRSPDSAHGTRTSSGTSGAR